ncbi:MAG: hypothetical protein KAH32_06105 [Chlamydiia bacterium]|nr:hypothetical protein [Chlamydiia bacterium]
MQNLDKITEEVVEDAIVKEEYVKLGTKMTACVLTLKDGFEVVGLAGVVDANTYDISMGSKFARVKAKDKVWEHLGSVLQYIKFTK